MYLFESFVESGWNKISKGISEGYTYADDNSDDSVKVVKNSNSPSLFEFYVSMFFVLLAVLGVLISGIYAIVDAFTTPNPIIFRVFNLFLALFFTPFYLALRLYQVKEAK